MKKREKIILGVGIGLAVIAVLVLIYFVITSPHSKTASFYSKVNVESFYYEAKITESEGSYSYKQAAKTQMVTTIADYKEDDKDYYHIFNGSYVFTIDMENQKYDTEVNTNGVNPSGIRLLFSRYEFDDFNKPDTAQDETFEGRSYYCETFKTYNDKGEYVGENKYYFDGDVLKVIVWVESDKIVRIMDIITYSNEVPENILFQPPNNFKAGQFIQTDVFDYSELIEDGKNKK